MFGLSFEKLIVIGVIAAFIIGPERLPRYAAQFTTFVRSLVGMANQAKDRMRDEMGPEFEDIDWKKLDPRQYDPRRIIREALWNDEDDESNQAADTVDPAAQRSPAAQSEA